MYIFIVNPLAGDGRAKRVFNKLQDTHTYKSIDTQFIYTEYKGHATEIATKLSNSTKQIDAIIIVGGDGTIYEFLNGFTNRSLPLSFLLGGSGNDFARGCSIEGSSETILKRVISAKNPVLYWPSVYESDVRKLVFGNSIGFGFDALIAKNTKKSAAKPILNKLGLGKLSYTYTLIKGLISFKPLNITVNVNGYEHHIKKCWIASASNHPYVGGGMKLVPQASNNERYFTVILIHSISRLKVMLLFMTVFSGLHTKLKEVEQIDTDYVEFTFENEIDLQVDGELSRTSACVVSKTTKEIILLGTHKNQRR